MRQETPKTRIAEAGSTRPYTSIAKLIEQEREVQTPRRIGTVLRDYNPNVIKEDVIPLNAEFKIPRDAESVEVGDIFRWDKRLWRVTGRDSVSRYTRPDIELKLERIFEVNKELYVEFAVAVVRI